jgi:peptide/nickel transport system substrate-binding protein
VTRAIPAPATLAPTLTPAQSPTPVPEGGTIIIGARAGNPNLLANGEVQTFQSNVSTLNPNDIEITTLPHLLSDALYDSLAQVDPQTGVLLPGLAESWQWAGDARTLRFHLRGGIRWTDGVDFSARDVVFTIKALSDPTSRVAPTTDFGPLANVVADDNLTVTVTFDEGYCPAATNLGTLKILPEHLLKQADLRHLKPAQLVGTGPLKIQDWRADQVTLVRNRAYWNGAPHIEQWLYKIFPDNKSVTEALTNKQIDLAAFDAPNVPTLTGVNLYPRAASQFYGIAINQADARFADPRVRQALSLALDRQSLLDEVLSGRGTLLASPILPDYWASPQNFAPSAFDLPRAKQLLADAGWRDSDTDGILDKDGKPFELTLMSEADDPIREPLAFHARAMFAALGIKTALALDDRAGWLVRTFEHKFDLLVVAWNIPLDPNQAVLWSSTEDTPGAGFNFVSFKDPRVDELLVQGRQADACERNARAQIYRNLFTQLAQDAPYIFLFAPQHALAANPRVAGLAPSAFGGDFWNLNAWSVK